MARETIPLDLMFTAVCSLNLGCSKAKPSGESLSLFLDTFLSYLYFQFSPACRNWYAYCSTHCVALKFMDTSRFAYLFLNYQRQIQLHKRGNVNFPYFPSQGHVFRVLESDISEVFYRFNFDCYFKIITCLPS